MASPTGRCRVLALLSDAYGGGGGIAQFNRNLLEALAEVDGVDVRALALSGSSQVAVPAGVSFDVPAPDRKAGFAAAALSEVLRRRPGILLNGTVGFGPLALPLSVLAGARLWTTTHGIDVWQPGPWLDNAGLRRSALVTTVSRYTRTRLLEWCRLAPARVRLLHNTIDLARYVPGPPSSELRERYAARGRKVLLTVGRLSAAERYKGHDRVIRVLPRLAQAVGPLRYVVAGDGDDRPRLEALTARCGATDLVVFAGYVPEAELQEHYRLADAFVMPSTGEGFGIVFLEAMACGCPVVAGNRDGSVDALADGELGRLIDPRSPEDLLAALVATLSEPRRHDRAIPGLERFSLERFRARVRVLLASLREGDPVS